MDAKLKVTNKEVYISARTEKGMFDTFKALRYFSKL